MFIVLPVSWFILESAVGFVVGSDPKALVEPVWAGLFDVAVWASLAAAAVVATRVVANVTRRTDRLASAAGWQQR